MDFLPNEKKINHIAIIMDGNGRWAKKRNKNRLLGHRAGLKAVKEVLKAAHQNGIKNLTLYAFSSENWQRPEDEVSGLLSLFIYALERESNRLHKNNIKLNIIGDTSRFPEKLQEHITSVETLTKNNSALVLNIAANYGGRWDIVQACKKITTQIQKSLITLDDISEELINRTVLLNDMPPIDLVIRTGGEKRVSNFLLWQIAYSELYFTDVLWPDFNLAQFNLAIDSFYQRERRFGKL